MRRAARVRQRSRFRRCRAHHQLPGQPPSTFRRQRRSTHSRSRAAWIVRSGVNGSELASEFTELDLALQDHFYNFETRRWVVDEKAPLGRLVFYNGPKALVWLCALTTLALAAGPARWREKWGVNRRGLWLGVLVIATVPALAAISGAVVLTVGGQASNPYTMYVASSTGGVFRTTDNGVTWTSAGTDPSVANLTATGLSTGSVRFRVRAQVNSVWSDYCPPITVTIP